MTLYTNGRTIDYSVTPAGNYIETVSTKRGKIMHAYPTVHAFLNRILMAETASEITRHKEEDRKIELMRMIAWWELPTDHTFRGSFNSELYEKVRQTKLKK
jgi:hypothetical protein